VMERIGDWKWRFSSGRELYVVMDTIAIGLETLTVYSGCDHEFLPSIPQHDREDSDEELSWTPAERAELADAMIERWQHFKASACAGEHSFGRWMYGSGIDGTFGKSRVCHICGHSESVDVSETEYRQS